MKKLSLKKTTLSRLNNVGMSQIKGGDMVSPLPDQTENGCGICTGLCAVIPTKVNCQLTDECAPTEICR